MEQILGISNINLGGIFILTLKLCIIFIFLVILSYYDLCYHLIPNKILFVFGLIGILLLPFYSHPILLICGMFLPSSILFFINLFYPKYIGAGDIKLFMCLGLYMGAFTNCIIYLLSIFLSFFLCLLLIFTPNKSHLNLPFCPFVLVAFLILLNIFVLKIV